MTDKELGNAAGEIFAKARADLEQHLMTANMPNVGGAM